MKRFSFRLKGLLVLRELRETQAANLLAERLAHQGRLEQAWEQAQARAEAARANLWQAEGTRFGPHAHTAALADFDRRLADERAAQTAVQNHAKPLALARQAWAEAGRNVKIVSNLRAKAEERHLHQAARVEQAELDEAASRIVSASPSLLS